MSGAESVREKKWRNERDKKWSQRLCLQQYAQAVSILRDRNTASQCYHQEYLLTQAEYVIRDFSTARDCSLYVLQYLIKESACGSRYFCSIYWPMVDYCYTNIFVICIYHTVVGCCKRKVFLPGPN